MKTMKYVLNSVNEQFVLIPDNGMQHTDIRGNGNWTNAGFVSFDTTTKDSCGNIIVKPHCYGKSVSLDLSCGDNDSAIIYKGIKDAWLD
jgi:hypothetical protein